jgi:hypothetical protein
MVRLELKLMHRESDVSDAWIDNLFDDFDADGSGYMDNSEWDELVALLKRRAGATQFDLSREQVRKMIRVQLKLDDAGSLDVSDAWIDNLFDEFDADQSGSMDNAEWDDLVVVLKERTVALAAAQRGVPHYDDLRSLSVAELKRRARKLGVDEETIHEIDDEEDIKAAAIELVHNIMITSQKQSLQSKLDAVARAGASTCES